MNDAYSNKGAKKPIGPSQYLNGNTLGGRSASHSLQPSSNQMLNIPKGSMKGQKQGMAGNMVLIQKGSGAKKGINSNNKQF